ADAYISINLYENYKSRFSFPKEGDILISAAGTIGRTIRYDGKDAYFQDSNIVWIDNKEIILSNKYLYYVLQIVKYNTEGGTIQRLYNSILKSTKFILPPLPEQQAIAEVLSDTDAWIESLEKLIAKKRLIKQGAMQELLTPKDGWEVKKLGEIADCLDSFRKPLNDNQRQKMTGDIPYCGANGIVDYINDYSIDDDIILMAEDGGYFDEYKTRPIAYRMNGKCWVNNHVHILKARLINQSFLFYSIVHKDITEYITGGTRAKLNKSVLLIIDIHFPKSHPEQTRIATILSDMDVEIEALENKLAKARQIKQGMMQELLTGRVRLVDSIQTKQVKTKKRNEHIDDAILIATMASCFASEQFPLTRFKYTKISYLLKRYKEEQTADYLKKAAGPYNPKTRYGGAEKIALENKYVVEKESIYKGTSYKGFVPSEKINVALDYFKEWYGEDSLVWIQQFKVETHDNLELWATVDMAIQDLKKENKNVNVESIKQVIKNNKEWRGKLKRPIFSDVNILKAINKVNGLYAKI
ncbi:restriction endonuclease subunit S, partial [Bacteroidales bacterium OttesenSCG-928-L19]|nr:restriction endonuclease subunit S [Bacteroidales bacterium OttesenSCG-928-L19]